MAKQIGIWIDHKRAVILTVSEKGEVMRKIESGIEHLRLRGVPRSRAPYSAQYQKGDDQFDKQYYGHLNKYYESVLALVRGADEILIFGPPVKGIFPADKLTDRQFAAKVRSHFAEVGERA